MLRFIKGLVNKLSNMKILKKLIAIYTVSVLLPLLIIGVYLTLDLRNTYLNASIAQSTMNNVRISSRIGELLNLLTNISDKIYYDNEILQLISSRYSTYEQVIKSYKDCKQLDDYIVYYPQVDSIMLYVDNDTMVDNGHFTRITTDIRNLTWFQNAVNSDGELLLEAVPDNFTKFHNMSLVRKIPLGYGDKYAVLAINISYSYLRSLCDAEAYKTYITVNRSTIVLSEKRREIGDDYDTINIDKQVLQKEEPAILQYGDSKSVIFEKSFTPLRTKSSVQVITIMPVSALDQTSQNTLIAGLLITTLLFIPTCGVIVLFSRSLSRRIGLIREEMHKAVTGDFNISAESYGQDEVGELHADLVTMIGDMEKLIGDMYEERLQKEKLMARQKEVEFKMLASQINPHFLFNTLETIRMKANVNGDKEVAQAIMILGKTMRHIIEMTNTRVQLASELDQVKSYLDIQKFRFGDKIQYRITVEYDIVPANYFILPLLLQPLVENAFVHGLETQDKGGMITIELYSEGEQLIISVADNGAGLDEESVAALNLKINQEAYYSSKSIGLCNVNQRIKLYYGQEYGLTLESAPGIGTNVTMHLPLTGKVVSDAQSIDS